MATDATGETTQSVPGILSKESAPACEGHLVGRRDCPGDCARTSRASDRQLAFRRRLIVAVCLLTCAIVAFACWEYVPGVLAWLADVDAVRGFVADHAVLSRLALVGINIAQVILAFLPGEPVELAMGYAFGFWEGTLLCIVGSVIARTAVYWAVRRWGWNLVGLFFDRSRLESFSWLHNARRVEVAMFIVFLIPGTPKDVLTYFAGLTKMRYPSILLISTVGTLPSIVTSTIVAAAVGDGNYLFALAFVILGVLLVAVGAVAYRQYHRHATKGGQGGKSA